MRLFVIILGASMLLAMGQAIPFDMNIQEEWQMFKIQHNKVYNSANEERERMEIFQENLQEILKHNELQNAGKVSYKLGLNQLADMSLDEVKSIMNGFKYQEHKEIFRNAPVYNPPSNISVDNEMDWRNKGAVTPVKDQGQCGSCWSFSATGALESQHFLKTGQLVSLSEQNLVDCSNSYGNMGCMGGWPSSAFQYITDNGGIDTEDSYPYEAINNQCRFNANSVGATATGFVKIPVDDEEALKNAVATNGPISVGIDASHQSFQLYKAGVYNEPQCSSSDLDHAVLVVGYGTDAATGLDYWLVKNSWGTSWGEQGYIRMARNQKNQCGIVTAATYPTV
ncbi:cathepsin L-like [Haematobia irritans]|uniref:cathepsin L-like n=1 Tax=Haematobia irritans TaxID=7368 RepID=UPI003F50D256